MSARQIVVVGFSIITFGITTSGFGQQVKDDPQSSTQTNVSAGLSDPSASDHSPELGILVGSCPGEAVCVRDTILNSPADLAGIREGDYIIRVDGEKVASPLELKQAIESHKTGGMITVIFWRDGRERIREIELASESKELPTSHKAWLGVMLTNAVDGGVIIEQVVPEGPAARSGVQAGDIITKLNEQPVESVQNFVQNLSEMDPGTKIRLTIRRNEAEQTLTPELGTVDDAPMRFLRGAFRPPMFDLPSEMTNVNVDPMIDTTLDEMRRQIRDLQDQVRQLTDPQRQLWTPRWSANWPELSCVLVIVQSDGAPHRRSRPRRVRVETDLPDPSHEMFSVGFRINESAMRSPTAIAVACSHQFTVARDDGHVNAWKKTRRQLRSSDQTKPACREMDGARL